MLFGPKRPMTRQIGSNEDNPIISIDKQQRFLRPGASSTRNNVLAKSLNFAPSSKGIGQNLMKR